MTQEDHIEGIIGSFGRYQTWILVLVSLGRLPTDYQLSNVVFILPNVEYVCMDAGAYNLTNHCPCENPVYDTSTIVTSVTSTWNLICDRTQLASLAQSFLQVGILAGSLFYGYISDRYGRKFAVLLALHSVVLFVAASAAVSELWMFIAARFLMGTGVGGTMLCCYIMIIELTGKSFRPYITGLHEISYMVAYISLPGLAYLFREWRHLQLVISVPWLFVIGYSFVLPESPRWLITVGRKDEAVEILTKIAKRNRRPTDNIRAVVDKVFEETVSSNSQQYGTYLDILRSPKLRKYAFICALVWFCCAHTFFGVNQYIGRLEGDIYLNVLISALILSPSVILVIIATLYFKRKTSTVFTFSITGFCLLTFLFIPNHLNVPRLIMAFIGLTGAYTSFVLIYLYCSEVFPTVIRNSAMGFASMFARFGGFIAPFVVNIGVEWASLAIFSSLAFLAAILCCFLPETKGIVLLNSIEQTEKSEMSNVNSEVNNTDVNIFHN